MIETGLALIGIFVGLFLLITESEKEDEDSERLAERD